MFWTQWKYFFNEWFSFFNSALFKKMLCPLMSSLWVHFFHFQLLWVHFVLFYFFICLFSKHFFPFYAILGPSLVSSYFFGLIRYILDPLNLGSSGFLGDAKDFMKICCQIKVETLPPCFLGVRDPLFAWYPRENLQHHSSMSISKYCNIFFSMLRDIFSHFQGIFFHF